MENYLVHYKSNIPKRVKDRERGNLEDFQEYRDNKKKQVRQISKEKSVILNTWPGVKFVQAMRYSSTFVVSAEYDLILEELQDSDPDILAITKDVEIKCSDFYNSYLNWQEPSPWSNGEADGVNPTPEWRNWGWGYMNNNAGGLPYPAPASVFLGNGVGVGVAILDTGISTAFPELNISYTPGVDSLAINFSDSVNGYADVHGHGTACAGIVGATHGGGGVLGIAPNCILHNIKVVGDNGIGSVSWLINGLEYCLDQIDKISVINMSLGGDTTLDPSLAEIYEDLKEAGVLIAVAAGNGAAADACDQIWEISGTSQSINVFTVGAVEVQGDTTIKRPSYSAVGDELDFVAPADVYCPINWPLGSEPLNWCYRRMDGTSAATPHIAGVLALLKSYNSDIEFETAYDLLKKSSYTRGKQFYQDYIDICPVAEGVTRINSNFNDGTLMNTSSNWENCRNEAETAEIHQINDAQCDDATRVDNGPPYSICRSFFYFDLSALDMTGKIITGAIIDFATVGWSYISSRVCVQQGLQSIPLVIADWNAFTGGLLAPHVPWEPRTVLQMTQEGITYIENIVEAKDTALFCLREYSRDYLNIAPNRPLQNTSCFSEYAHNAEPRLWIYWQSIGCKDVLFDIACRNYPYEEEVEAMPLTDLYTDISVLNWPVGDLREDNRIVYEKKEEALQAAKSYPYIVRLSELPHETSGVQVVGYTIVAQMPISSTECYVDYESGKLYFFSTEAGKFVTVSYYGKGSVVVVEDVNRFSDFLCLHRNALFAFSVSAFSPVDTKVLITGGYVTIDEALLLLPAQVLAFGTGEEHELSAIPPNYYCRVLICVSRITGEYVVTQGVAVPVMGTINYPEVSSDTKPCACILVRDNGSGGVGTIFDIEQSCIEDVRTFVRM